MAFVNYVSPQSSAWLRVFVCFDRYLSLSRLTRTWFNQSKGILIIIACIVGVIAALNFHLLIFACFYNVDGTVNPQARQYNVYPMWDYVHLFVYTGVPFVLMVVFNSGVVYHLLRIRRESTLQNSRIQHRAISITLVVTTSLFLILTTPSGVAFLLLSQHCSRFHPTIARCHLFHVSHTLVSPIFDHVHRVPSRVHCDDYLVEKSTTSGSEQYDTRWSDYDHATADRLK